MAKPFEFDIAVGGPDSARSRIWKTWATERGDAYALGLGFGQFEKLSIHRPNPPNFPDWRSHIKASISGERGMTRYRSGSAMLNSVGNESVITHWPGAWVDTVTLIAATIVIPATELRPSPTSKYAARKVRWLKPAPVGWATEVVWVVGTNGTPRVTPTAPYEDLEMLAEAKFRDGISICVMSVNLQRDTLPGRLRDARAYVDRAIAERPATSPPDLSQGRAVVGMKGDLGYGSLWDIAASSEGAASAGA